MYKSVCKHVCMCANMCVPVYICACACLCTRTCTCMCVCMHACVYVYTATQVWKSDHFQRPILSSHSNSRDRIHPIRPDSKCCYSLSYSPTSSRALVKGSSKRQVHWEAQERLGSPSVSFPVYKVDQLPVERKGLIWNVVQAHSFLSPQRPEKEDHESEAGLSYTVR